MDSIHCIQLSFPEKLLPKKQNLSEVVHKNDHFPLPRIAKQMKNKLISVNKIENPKYKNNFEVTKTTIRSVEEIFSPDKSVHKTQRMKIEKKIINDNVGNYMRFCDKIEKQKIKRSNNQSLIRKSIRDNPWRYSIDTTYSVFDVKLLAESTFNNNIGK